MWESPIQILTDDIVKDIARKEDELLMESVHRVGFNIDKDELVKALNYDRDQYEKGYADGIRARNSEIVRCCDCKHNPSKDEWIHCNRVTWWNSPDDYCSRGERKETEDDDGTN
jgi:hypothetical protein